MSTTSSLITLKQEVEHDSPLIDASRNAFNHGRYDSLPQTFKRVLNEGGNGALGEFGEFFVYLTSQWYPLLEQGKWRELCRVEDAFAKEPPPSDAFLELLNPVLDDCLRKSSFSHPLGSLGTTINIHDVLKRASIVWAPRMNCTSPTPPW